MTLNSECDFANELGLVKMSIVHGSHPTTMEMKTMSRRATKSFG